MTIPKKLPEDLLKRGVEEIIQRPSLEEKLNSGRPLRIKHGVDPTTKDLHLGYAVVYQKLKAFQDLGHTIIFLVGDFTARFGDPTDKEKTRKLRTREEVEEGAQSYIKQIGLILDLKKTEIRRNSEWYDKMSAEELLHLQSHFTISRLLERDMFQKRIKEKREIGFHEPVYPILQAYDSVQLKSDLTIIGTDQKFNELQGRILQKEFGQAPQDVMTMKLLIGLDGKRKMSQSLGNYIGIAESPNEMYGKTMSIPDSLIMHYFELATRLSVKELTEINSSLSAGENPRDIKARLAREIASLYHGKKAAQKAAIEFDSVFREKKTPADLPTIKLTKKKVTLIELLVEAKAVSSKAEARRLIEQGGVKIDGQAQTDWQNEIEFKKGTVVQVGKRKFVKIG
ncbi:MAG: tyrosine--tRNA ligase [Patescibacteria group bacterium]|nr:tyrosine--tRNA ligase [Patescibacteria group bacterium]